MKESFSVSSVVFRHPLADSAPRGEYYKDDVYIALVAGFSSGG
jgi:hypothetical protein